MISNNKGGQNNGINQKQQQGDVLQAVRQDLLLKASPTRLVGTLPIQALMEFTGFWEHLL